MTANHVGFNEWNAAPLELRQDIAAWCIEHGHHNPESADVIVLLAQPWRLVLGVEQLVELLVRTGVSPAIRAIADFPDVETRETINELWSAVLYHHRHSSTRKETA
jgi:hypothetical protein